MIKIQRADKPHILRKHAEKWTKKLLSAKTKKERRNAESKYQHEEIKEALVNMFHGKCAYCESKITHVDYGHIEHYRPRSLFPKLTFEWSNLFLACGVCNGAEHKSDHFPEVDEGGPLINPCDENPADYLNFYYDPTVRIASVYGKTPRGETTEKLLGLNRYDLRAYRSRQITRLYVLAQCAKNDPEAKVLFEEARQDNAEYAAFARQIKYI
jgi:uncharacterized protein (TIGR02646 family)